MMRLIAILLVSVLLTSCGFQLRGTGGQALSVERVQVVGSEPELMDELEDSLKSIGVDVSDATDPEYVIDVAGESLSRRAVASSGNITVSEYEVQLRASFVITGQNGELILPATQLRAERVYSFDPNNFVSNNEEEALLIDEMRQDVAGQLLRRFSASLRNLGGS